MSEPQGAPICIKDGLVSLCVGTPDGAVEIARVPGADHRLTDERARTSRPAPPAVPQPLVPVAGVVPLGELELIEALSAPDIVVADGRKPDQYVRYTIPGAVNLPFTETEQALEHLGCRRGPEGWDWIAAMPPASPCSATVSGAGSRRRRSARW